MVLAHALFISTMNKILQSPSKQSNLVLTQVRYHLLARNLAVEFADPKDPASKKVSARSGQKVEKFGRCTGHERRAERRTERYLEFWQLALTQASHEDDLAAAASQASTTEAAPEPKDREDLADAAQEPTEQSDHGDEGKYSWETGEETKE